MEMRPHNVPGGMLGSLLPAGCQDAGMPGRWDAGTAIGQGPRAAPGQFATERVMDWMILGAITFFAAVAQSATGFGFAIVAVPLYLVVLNSHSAVQLAIVVTPVISLVLLPRLGSHLERPLLMRLVLGTVLGLPIGMAVFLYAELAHLKFAVAFLIILFAGLFLAGLLRGRGNEKKTAVVPSVAKDVLAGVVSGAMTTSLGMPGPPVVLYFSTLGLHKNATRATILALFLFSYAGAIAMQAGMAGISVHTWRMAGIMIPFVLLGSLGGNFISGLMSQTMFRAATLLLLLVTGLYMLYATVFPA